MVKQGDKLALDIPEQVSVLLFLEAVLSILQVLEEFTKSGRRVGESTGKGPAIPITVLFVQAGDMFN